MPTKEGEQVKFSDVPYKRPNFEQIKEQLNISIKNLRRAKGFQEALDVIKKINSLRDKFDTARAICEIRYCEDTRDLFYSKEKDFFDSVTPTMEGITTDYYKALVESDFRSDLEKELGSQLFSIAELTVKTFSPQVLDKLVQENKLRTEYSKLLSSAQVVFNGKKMTLPQLRAFEMSKDREIRKKAAETRYEFFSANSDKFDEIYDNLVKLRTQIAKELGFGSFVELAYARLKRSDYTPKMVSQFRKGIKEHVVPVVSDFREFQAKRIEVEKLKYYDRSVFLKEGNPVPRGSQEQILENAKKMYHDLSRETAEFFDFMLENNLLDLTSREGKFPGGFCHFISEHKFPFILANFNGTAGDVEVLTHEAGHAFQVYRSRDYEIPEYHWPTLEACEIHSMGMEFITWPWMELFYHEEADKARFVHIAKALNFIPYGTCVDEFQHFVYENPQASPKERRRFWRDLEKIYMPEIDYDGNEYLEQGGYWHQQSHIFEDPFYYIDYVLAQICAFQLWMKFEINRDDAWKNYLNLCDAGGSKPFLELLKIADLASPFISENIASVASSVHNWIRSHAH